MRYLSPSFIFSLRSWRKRQEMYGCKMPEVLIANASHRLLMRCNNEVTQWELAWIIGVWMHIVSRTRSNSKMHTRAECWSDTHFQLTPHSKQVVFLLYHSELQMFCQHPHVCVEWGLWFQACTLRVSMGIIRLSECLWEWESTVQVSVGVDRCKPNVFGSGQV